MSSSVVFRRDLVQRAVHLIPRSRRLKCAISGCAVHCVGPDSPRPVHATCHSVRRAKSEPAHAMLMAEQAVQFYEKHRDITAVPAAIRRRVLSASLVTQGKLLRASDPARAARCICARVVTPADGHSDAGTVCAHGLGFVHCGNPLRQKPTALRRAATPRNHFRSTPLSLRRRVKFLLHELRRTVSGRTAVALA